MIRLYDLVCTSHATLRVFPSALYFYFPSFPSSLLPLPPSPPPSRPAYMDEYEKLERELQKQYEVYVEKHCNLSYLEHQLREVEQAEQDKMEVSTWHGMGA